MLIVRNILVKRSDSWRTAIWTFESAAFVVLPAFALIHRLIHIPWPSRLYARIAASYAAAVPPPNNPDNPLMCEPRPSAAR